MTDLHAASAYPNCSTCGHSASGIIGGPVNGRCSAIVPYPDDDPRGLAGYCTCVCTQDPAIVAWLSGERTAADAHEVPNHAPRPLATATIRTNSGTYTTPCEPINEWLAIVPVLDMDEGGNTVLHGTFTITHLPTGLAFSLAGGCVECCRQAGRELAALNLDWSAITDDRVATATLDDETKMALVMARDIGWRCDAEYCTDGEDGADA